VSYQIDGDDSGGNTTYLSSALSGCSDAVGGSTNEATCNVNWSSFGDQWLTATYTSPSTPSVSRTLEVQIAAPIDLGAGYAYSTYGNVDPGAIDDCTMASVADWIETTLGTTPADAPTIAAYWAAEDDDNGGADVGLTSTQLFDYWSTTGIDGSYLTSADPVSLSSVETMLSDRYVLIATASLPDNFPLGGAAAAHMWIVVGYSSLGPMIVTWGQEFQVTWSEFDSWTTGIWSIGLPE